jgi:hypothetical protein
MLARDLESVHRPGMRTFRPGNVEQGEPLMVEVRYRRLWRG